MLKTIRSELKAHAPFTAIGALTGVWILLLTFCTALPRSSSVRLFWTLHPTHVFLSALATAGMYKLHGRSGFLKILLIGYFGSVGICTLSDSCIPYAGELILDLPNRDLHLGFIEKWWLVNPLALGGIYAACLWPRTKFPHAGHVLLSTWASLFHITMAVDGTLELGQLGLVFIFLFFAVWVPCCTSDIVLPLVFVGNWQKRETLSDRVRNGGLRIGGL